MSPPGHTAYQAVVLLRALLDAGVRDVVLCPGSRSAPLALALYAADAAGDLRLHVRIDERSAGFLALGLTIGSGRPVAVVTTSGTAVGNLLPAVMEAYHGGRRLIVVSADRPAAMRGTAANQTTWQTGIFGRFAESVDLAVGALADEVSVAVGEAVGRIGPSHLNVQFDTPLLPEPGMPWWPASQPGGGLRLDPVSCLPPRVVGPALSRGPLTVVVAGDDAGPGARVLAESAGWPLLAEPTSGARAGEHAIRCYRLLLGSTLGAQIERVVVVGHPTLSRPVAGLLARHTVELLAVAPPSGHVTTPEHRAQVLSAVPAAPESPPSAAEIAWLAAWRGMDAEVSARLDQLVEALPELDALQVAQVVGEAVTPGTALIVGSSNPVRDLDLMLVPYVPRGRRRIVGNRGLAGIDGLVSTAIGVDLGRAGAPRSLALLGDLSFLHDSNGLLLGPDEPRPDLTVVVVNDDGGSIFTLLEQGGPEYSAGFERVFATPHHADLEAVCRGAGTAYRLAATREELRAAIADPAPGLRVVEVRASRAHRRATAAAIAALVDNRGMSPSPPAAR
jgi:2-succinyl-5-enolpyruvyl-6-hydroxy-3-cyclohexene-1-carboxylate synthase